MSDDKKKDNKAPKTQLAKAAILSAILVTSVLALSSSPLMTIHNAAASGTPTITWTGAGNDGLWSNPANWSPNRLPTSTDQIEIGANYGGYQPILDIDFTLDASGTLTIGSAVLDSQGNAQASIYVQPGKTLDNNGGTVTVIYNGILGVDSNGNINNGGTITNDGKITNSGTIDNKAGGTITNNAGGTIDNSNGTIINECGATFTNNGTLTGNPVQNKPCPDTTPPTVSITSPNDGAYLNTAQFQVQGTSSDNAGGSGVQSVTVEIDGGSPYTATPKSSGDLSTWSITTPSLLDGSHTIKATATDGAGNQGTATIKITIDTSPPDTLITSAKDGKGNTIPKSDITHSKSITFTFTGTDNTGGSGIAGFQCSLDSINDFSTCNSPQSYSGLTAGTHTFYVRSTDKAGNADPTPATFKWKIN